MSTRMTHISRRHVLRTGALTLSGLTAHTICVGAQAELPPTPECRDNDPPTLPDIEGPFYKPSSPERADLVESAGKGRPAEFSGFVLTRGCRPVARALLDLWHADEGGEYDNRGFRYRGHVFTDEQGRYRFRTILPGLYPGRTRHYHLKVQAAGQPQLLTTQLYFPNEPANLRDGFFRRELLMKVSDAGERVAARFDFVLDMR
jgi:protocatechuate 3,4-dioxygenase beta subunit